MFQPLIVGIAGGTASGKTTVANKIVSRLQGCRVSLLDQDSYYRDLSDMSFEERVEINFDHPDAFDTDLLVSHLRDLKAGKAVEKPHYSFVNCVREKETTRIEPADAIVLEGILVLSIEAVRKELGVRIFVDADDDVRIIRRLTRGFVERSKRYAHIIIPHGGNNDVSIEMVVGAIRARLPPFVNR